MKTTCWQQGFENFECAYFLLKSVFDERDYNNLSALEKEGTIQRFKFTFELGWKTLKDYLEYTGIILEQTTPRAVIKQAFASQIIQNGETWIAMLEHRNLMSYTYNGQTFNVALKAIHDTYLAELNTLYQTLKALDDKT